MPTPKRIKKKANSRAKRPVATPVAAAGRRLSQELVALLLVVLDLFLILSLVSFNPADPQTVAGLSRTAAVSNWAGKAGALCAAWLMDGLGLAAFWLPIMVSWLALQSFQGSLGSLSPWTGAAYLALPLASAGLLTLSWPMIGWGGGQLAGGGAIGAWLTRMVQPVLNLAGSLLVFTALALASFMGITRLSYVALLQQLGAGLRQLVRRRPRQPVSEPEPDLLKSKKPEVHHGPPPEIARPGQEEVAADLSPPVMASPVAEPVA
ncbi:MAG: DNA translocase FtsK 4TM domain-containing protein, partial [Desulfobacca sp.]|uniref:DNA translocase FtsK 4TM domain-containing protein n=1 Tax=Desulfobacca sp. TaxID=2067990 RepID=UPI00404B25E9